MEINGKTRVCGLLGNPVEHTLSPMIHNTLAKILGHDMVYVPFLVEPGRVAEAVTGSLALNLLGLNVTVPYKSEVITSLQEMDDLAGNIGAVNTLVRTEGGYKGYNTDMEGLYRAMTDEGISMEDYKIMLDRTPGKAQTVAGEVNRTMGRDVIVPMAMEEYNKLPEGKFLAIQGTSVGLAPHVEEVVIADEAFYEKIHTGFDLIYSPWETRFMKMTKAHGGRAYNGLKMLLYQGIIAYELWNRVSVSKEDAQVVYEKLKAHLTGKV